MASGDCVGIGWTLSARHRVRCLPAGSLAPAAVGTGAALMRYSFDQFELDTEHFLLQANAAEIHVEPLVFDLLSFLVERSGQVVSRAAIIENLWKGRSVSDATVSSCIKSVRRALGDSGQAQTYLRTIRGRGFQFAAPVERVSAAFETPPAAGEPAQAQSVPGRPQPGSAPPRIAVLPLFALSPDPQLGLLGDALAQEVILELSRLHWLFVIARGSSFKFRGQEVDPAQAGAILSADYLLTGTIMQEGRRCVVAVELCHAPANTVIWAERFTTPVGEIMHLRSTLAGEIVGALEPRLQLSEAMQASRVPTPHLNAWAAYHRGLWQMFRFDQQGMRLAAQLFARAVELDPTFARAHAGLSFTHFQDAFLGFSSDPEGEKRQARAYAEKSLEFDPLDPFVNLTMGRGEWVYGHLDTTFPPDPR